jgi:hypothetical protein
MIGDACSVVSRLARPGVHCCNGGANFRSGSGPPGVSEASSRGMRGGTRFHYRHAMTGAMGAEMTAGVRSWGSGLSPLALGVALLAVPAPAGANDGIRISRCGVTLSVPVVARNDRRSDARFRGTLSANCLRRIAVPDAHCLRSNAQSVRRTRDGETLAQAS